MNHVVTRHRPSSTTLSQLYCIPLHPLITMRPPLGLGLSVLGRPLTRAVAPHVLRLGLQGPSPTSPLRLLSTISTSTPLPLHLSRRPRPIQQLQGQRQPHFLQPLVLVQLQTQHRAFHPTPPHRDIFFLSIPAIKTGLLNITRFTLLFLPFVVRYKWVILLVES